MTTEKVEFDAALGGSVELPDLVSTYRYAAERVDEIKDLVTAINNPNQTKLVFQTLPKHMRRRAMSHNPKRLPRKYRQSHIGQMRKSGLPTKGKRPSRKYRRKATNLMKEYIRRQKKNIWLETHLWHAKRFHMVDQWGYKLPLKSCDKTYRSNYRATKNHCLIQDISYVGCIELTGSLELFRNRLIEIQNPNQSLSICAKAYTTGKREGTVDLFKRNSFPFGAIGTVSFIWKPEFKENSDRRTVWFFAHASFYRVLVNELVDLFYLKDVSLKKNSSEAMDVNDSNENDMDKLVVPKYFNTLSKIELVELKDCLNRFRLTGPLSQAVLSNALVPKKFSETQTKTWFTEFLTIENAPEVHSSQMNFWSNIKSTTSPGELPPGMILALNVNDPRTIRPNKRTKAVTHIDSSLPITLNRAVLDVPKDNAISQLWDTNSRLRICSEKMSTSDFCKMRNKRALVPGEKCAFEKDLQPVPVILIQRPGVLNPKFKQLGYGCGWDVIVPMGYGIATWMAFIMWGAKAGGLREIESVNRESGTEEFAPDTVSGKVIADERYQDLRNKYFRLPPNYRPNYIKLSINSPFKCHWLKLIQEWTSPSITDYCVLRQPDILQRLQTALKKTGKPVDLRDIPENSLIPIYLVIEGRGDINNFSIVCLATPKDVKVDLKKRQSLNTEPVYSEPLKADDKEALRKLIRTKHLQLLKRLRRQRVRAKRRHQETSQSRVRISKAKTQEIVQRHRDLMRELWLPEPINTVRFQCSREVIGYVTCGDFSFTEATSAGVAYITRNGLNQLLTENFKGSKSNRVLVRNPSSRQYRFGTFKIKV